MESERRRGLAWALGSALASGLFVIPWKLASEHGSGEVMVLLLLAVAALFNTAAVPLIRRERPVRSLSGIEVLLSFELAALTLLGNRASAAAISQLSPAVLSVLLRTDVLVVAVLAWWLLGERVERRYWLGTAVAGLGLWWMRQPEPALRFGLSGSAFALIAASCFAAMSVLTRRYIQSIEPTTVNALRLWIAVPMWFAIYGVPPALRAVSGRELLYASAAAAIGPGFSRLALMYSARHVEARLTALMVLSAPLVSLVLEYVLLGEVPAERQLAGGAVMLLGLSIPFLHVWSGARSRAS